MQLWKLPQLDLINERCAFGHRFFFLPEGITLYYRELPKRPTGLAFTSDNQTILVSDKFGDVFRYLYPLFSFSTTSWLVYLVILLILPRQRQNPSLMNSHLTKTLPTANLYWAMPHLSRRSYSRRMKSTLLLLIEMNTFEWAGIHKATISRCIALVTASCVFSMTP